MNGNNKAKGTSSPKGITNKANAQSSLKGHSNGHPAITKNAIAVLEKRYLAKDPTGKIIETPAELFRRVARALAEPDLRYDPHADIKATEDEFYRLMASLDFLPNSPTLMNAGTGAGTLSACFVLPLEDSMEGIMKTAHDAAMVQKYGGGTGFALSFLRPKGAPIATTHGKACGPIAVLKHLSSVSNLVTQGGRRDGANMAVMAITHPNITDFITCKEKEGEIHNFNISVGVTDDFMRKVEAGEEYDLIDPHKGNAVKKLNAREVFQKIVEGAWRNGEPGMIFLDRVNQDNPTPQLGDMTATNPCGEQPLLPYESCNLGSINLGKMVSFSSGKPQVDWDRLRAAVQTVVHLLDNVIDANKFSIPEIEMMTKATRKIGLGVMGYADMLITLRIPYDSEEGVEMGRRVMRFIKEESDKASTQLAKTRGPFPAYHGSRLEAQGVLPIRNACRLTVAPTGTIAMIAGASGGIEPIFALAYRKHNILEGQSLYYGDPKFEAVAKKEGFYSEELMEYISKGGSIQSRPEVPEWVKRVFVVASDISPEWHVRMQAAFQESVDAAISKTINFPNSATVQEVWGAYTLAWDKGCKGITVYRAGSRAEEVLTAGLGEGAAALAVPPAAGVTSVPRERPQDVSAVVSRVRTGHGNMYITISFDEAGRPFEVFSTLGKAGGCDSAQLEAISRLISLALRSGIDPAQVVDQLRGITCCPIYDEGVLVRSTPDAVALALSRQLGAKGEMPQLEKAISVQLSMPLKSKESGNGDRTRGAGHCPECGSGLSYEEGCLMCHSCGYSRC